jgi:pimeloyl-ACP methyl ester carboxylesterase
MRRPLLLSLVLAVALLLPTPAQAKEPLLPVSLPVLGSELNRGAVATTPEAPLLPQAKTIDGQIGDWAGRPSRYGGTSIYSAGEYVYQDYLFDAYGADNGEDVDRNQELEALANVVPETYRAEAAFRYLAGELGVGPPVEASTNYGDLGPLFTADLEELHVSPAPDGLAVLARTTSLTATDQTALVLLFDTISGNTARDVGFNSGITTNRGDVAVLLGGSQGFVRNLATGLGGALPAGSVATDPSGFNNAIEALIPWSAIGVPAKASGLVFTAATGPYNPAIAGFANTGLPANLANVAYRTTEPVREWMERRQAFDLYAHTIDRFFTAANLDRARAGATERLVPGPGYHERTFLSAPAISREGGRDGIFQHYGLYLPKSFDPAAVTPLQIWLHWRGGTAHSAGSATPRIFRDMGDAMNTIVVSPRGRGTSSWYVGLGQADILEVWDDVMASYNVDQNRVYLAGHSMGGWGSFLFSVLYPDRFAAALPASPPGTQGLVTGLDFPGCEPFTIQDYNLCYSPTDDGRARDQAYQRMLGNLRNTPVAVFQGVEDELVWYSGVFRNHLEMLQLGLRHRLYSFPTQEHYGPPVWDQWLHGAKYMHTFVRNPNPPHVTYRRDMPFERAVEEIRNGGVHFQFDFDHAYWMSELTPADLAAGFATFDGVSLAIPEHPYRAVPEAQGPLAPGQTGPYLMTGMKWLNDPTAAAPAAVNGFRATLQNAAAVKLDLARMRVSPGIPITGTITTNRPLQLRLTAAWPSVPEVQSPSGWLSPSLSGSVLTLQLPAGTTTFTILS